MSSEIHAKLKELLDKGVKVSQAKFLLGIVCREELSLMSGAEKKRVINKAFNECGHEGTTFEKEVYKGMPLADYVDVKKEYL